MPLFFGDSKPQKGFSHNNFVAIFQRMAIALFQAAAPIYKRPIRRSEILDAILTIAKRNARVTARDLRFRIVRVQINVGKDATVRVPTADVRILVTERKLFAGGITSLDYQCRVRAFVACDDRAGRLRLRQSGCHRRIRRAQHSYRLFFVATSVGSVSLCGRPVGGFARQPKRRPALVAITRAIQVLSTASFAGNHGKLAPARHVVDRGARAKTYLTRNSWVGQRPRAHAMRFDGRILRGVTARTNPRRRSGF